MFDVEYGRWVEEHIRLVCELRAEVQEHPLLRENELGLFA
ncbi:bZIP transcription factor TGA10-like isoform X2 [Senna tora]|uniref:BZIP transcription factor TGA10-like isoform X2 n=1 Tax=Senna tora TaxID=362788 RepID=A0A834XEY2_9FABA|nr:bZIP transcription factor TGA10-like isoform X2 [Senna tora]